MPLAADTKIVLEFEGVDVGNEDFMFDVRLVRESMPFFNA